MSFREVDATDQANRKEVGMRVAGDRIVKVKGTFVEKLNLESGTISAALT